MPISRRGAAVRPLAAINLTALLDVMCNLLIVFMIVAPTLKSGLRIDLPQVENAPTLTPRKVFTISIQKADQPDGTPRLYLDDRRVDRDELRQALADLKVRYGTEFDVLIESDRLVPCEAMLQVLELTREVGLEPPGIVTKPPERDKK
jgi:biopolymer transport protein TolR